MGRKTALGAVAVLISLCTSQLPAVADDANTIAIAQKLNSQLSETFDKTGKYPEKANPSFHATVLKALTLIPFSSPSYAEAQALKAKFIARQPKITKIENAQTPPAGELPKISLGSVDMSYGMFKGSFVLTNPNPFPVADVRVSCSVYGGSGTEIKQYNFTVFELVPAKGKKQVNRFNFGFWPEQGKRVGCSTAGYQRR